MISYHRHQLDFFASLGTPLKRFFEEIALVQDRQTREAHLWMEAEERLAQIDFLVGRVKKLLRKHSGLLAAMTAASARARAESGGDKARFRAAPYLQETDRQMWLSADVAFEMKLSTEAFYYFAARFIKVLKCFTQFKNFDAPGVRNVRNRLLEHSENAGGVTQQDWGTDPKTGPALKSAAPRPPGKENVPKDAGLFINADELRDRLHRRLEQLLTPRP